MNLQVNAPTNIPSNTPVDPAALTIKPTKETYERLQQAHEYFNKALFGGTLPNALITFQRRKGIFGYFAGGRFQNDAGHEADEIALNPMHFASRSQKDILGTLVHEMAHQWQRHESQPGRGCYHNPQWAEKMKEIGLQPSDTGVEGGKETGETLGHYIITGVPFPFRRAYLRSVIDQVEVDDTEIRIHGRRDVLERLVMGGGATPAGVPSFVRKWRALQDSNL